MKTCTKCRSKKDLNQFNKDKSRRDGLSNKCKECIREYRKIHREQNLEKLRTISKEYGRTHRKEQLARNYSYRKRNYDKYRSAENKRKRRQYKENPNIFKMRKQRYANNHPEDKIRRGLRIRLLQAIKFNQKAGSAIHDLGCSIKEFIKYIESKFKSGMSWNNYGINGWHIDHIIPLSKFNLTIRKEFLKACHFTNMQPLWANENLAKGAL